MVEKLVYIQNFILFKWLSKTCVLLALVSGCICISCIEEITIENNNLESLLVVDATLTNQEIQQEIQLSRTFRFGENSNKPEENAQVKVIGNGVEYNFEEVAPGRYQTPFVCSAQPNVSYQLEIITSNGTKYTSTPKTLTSVTQIDALYANRIVNDNGIDGVAILVDSFDPTNSSNYYRYSFEETYKIIAPLWVAEDLFVISNLYPDCEVGFQQRTEAQRICYSTESSNAINITNTIALTEDKVQGHMVHFLSNQDFKISHRYSTLVHQFVISEETHQYLKTIQSFTSQGSLFSQLQAGFVAGNVSSLENENEKVVGFFEVSSVSSRRVFFNYNDLYPNTSLPPFTIICDENAPSLFGPFGSNRCGGLVFAVENRTRVYLEDYTGEPELFGDPGPYLLVPRACGDCTALGESEPPSFWID